ncbi:MAG: hypothetical protein COV70_02520 [Parcubacteria group bacterium CG11_big_fil_rev_8_21_14_0_20_39_22]|nr:MAG: hypothetical protein COV70_02520 [Parcubacteria group bacterium CG11_big_fil_rev_8_21_14_0_20_39_22]
MADISNKGENNRDEIEKMKTRLYSRDGMLNGRIDTGPRFKKHDVSVNDDWKGGEGDSFEQKILNERMKAKKQKMSGLTKLFLGALTFFGISLVAALYMFVGGGNAISSDNVDIVVVGPVSVAGGEEMSFEIQVTNRNNATLESPTLLLEYPEGVRREENRSEDIRRDIEKLENIAPGDTVRKKVQVVVFGEEEQTKNIGLSLEYRVAGSNAVFEKIKNYEVRIGSAPVSVSIDSIERTSSGQEFEMALTVSSNAGVLLEDVVVRAEYPFGFNFIESVPSPVLRSEIWNLGDVEPSSKKVIRIRGKLEGQNGEDRVFRFTVGTADKNDSRAIGIAFFTTDKTISIERPFLQLQLTLNNDSSSDKFIAGSAEIVSGDVFWTNNTSSRITNAKIFVELDGRIFDQSSVKAQEGFYRSSDNMIIWDSTNTRGLDVLDPGESGRVSFNFKILDTSTGLFVDRAPEMSINVSGEGTRVGDNQVPESIRSVATRDIEISTTLGLTSRATYYIGPFGNSGPMPPKVDNETTYTIYWTLTNSMNDLNNVVVEGSLPSYIEWKGVISPEGQKVTYNPVNGMVRWDAGTVSANAGFGGPVKEIAFQVGLTPSLSQVGGAPTLISDIKTRGDDSFTGAVIEAFIKRDITTRLSNDPAFSEGEAVVVE